MNDQELYERAQVVIRAIKGATDHLYRNDAEAEEAAVNALVEFTKAVAEDCRE